MNIEFMSWNTRLYMQGNRINNKQEKIDIEKSKEIIGIIKKHLNSENAIAVLQEIPYKINYEFEKHKKWDYHPIFIMLKKSFPQTEYDILYDDSYKWRIIQTVIIAKKGVITKSNSKSSNSFYNFTVGDLECLGVHSNDAFELRNWIAYHSLNLDLIAGDFNAGNYLLEDKKANNEISINRQNFLMLSEGYIDIFQGKITTNYKNVSEQRQIDHVFIKNSKNISDKYDYKNVRVDKNICLSDHYPLYWTILRK